VRERCVLLQHCLHGLQRRRHGVRRRQRAAWAGAGALPARPGGAGRSRTRQAGRAIAACTARPRRAPRVRPRSAPAGGRGSRRRTATQPRSAASHLLDHQLHLLLVERTLHTKNRARLASLALRSQGGSAPRPTEVGPRWGGAGAGACSAGAGARHAGQEAYIALAELVHRRNVRVLRRPALCAPPSPHPTPFAGGGKPPRILFSVFFSVVLAQKQQK